MDITSRALVSNLLTGKLVDRVPLRETFWNETLVAWVEQGYPTRRVYKEMGQKHWRDTDGRWVETTESGEYDEPIPPYQQFRF